MARTKGVRLLDDAARSAADFRDPLRIDLGFPDAVTRSIIFGAPLEGASPGVAEAAVTASDGLIYAVRAGEREGYENPLALFERVASPPPRPGGGGMQGLENLPPDVRRQIEQQLRQQGMN